MNVYLEMPLTFDSELQMQKFFNPLLHLIQDKKLLEYGRIPDIWDIFVYFNQYKCTQKIVKKCDYTSTITLTEEWNSVSESSNIVVFNALHRFLTIQHVLGKIKISPYWTKFGKPQSAPSHPLAE